MGFQDAKRAARRKVHETFSVPASYYEPNAIDPVDCLVRVLDVQLTAGDVDNMGWARRWASNPNVVFLTAEVIPKRKAKVLVYEDLARTVLVAEYVVEAVQPVYGETVIAECLRK